MENGLVGVKNNLDKAEASHAGWEGCVEGKGDGEEARGLAVGSVCEHARRRGSRQHRGLQVGFIRNYATAN